MPTVSEYVLYRFDELSDSAKEKAREWYRDDGGALHDEWYDAIYDDAARVANILGIDLRTKPVKLMGGGTRYDPCIYFSGFWSQGDGACFEGNYEYAKGSAKAIRKYAPEDAELHRIADCLFTIQKQARYRLTASVKHRGHYYHSGCTEIDVSLTDGNDASLWDAQLTQLLRDFMDWIYSRLEKECEWLNSDESVDDNIRANEYTFDEDGNRDD